MELPQATAKDVVDALRSVMRSVRLDSACLCAQILADPDSPEAINYVEEWPTEVALESRVGSPQFGTLLALMEAVPSPPTLEFRVIDEIRGLEFVETVRSRGLEQLTTEEGKAT